MAPQSRSHSSAPDWFDWFGGGGVLLLVSRGSDPRGCCRPDSSLSVCRSQSATNAALHSQRR